MTENARTAALGVAAVLVGVAFAAGPAVFETMTPKSVTALLALVLFGSVVMWATCMAEDGKLGDFLRRFWDALRRD